MPEMQPEEIYIREIVRDELKGLEDRLAKVEFDLARTADNVLALTKFVKTGLEPEC